MTDAMMASPSARQAIAETNRKFESALNAGDPRRAAQEVYTSDARVLAPGAPMIQGRDNIAQFWETAVPQMGIERVELTTLELEVASDSAFEVGRATLTLAGGQTVVAKYVVVWKLDGSQWRWHIDIWNTDS